MEKISDSVAEILINQDKIFKKNFLKFLKIYVKTIKDEKKYRAQDLACEIDKLFNGEDKAICVFVLTYMIGKAFTLEEYEKIDTFIGNYYV
jgi:hypothetical protein